MCVSCVTTTTSLTTDELELSAVFHVRPRYWPYVYVFKWICW